MKLRTALNVITETKILISGAYEGKYEDVYLIIDYLGDQKAFSKALNQRQKLEKENPAVTCIAYNKALGCIEIDIK